MRRRSWASSTREEERPHLVPLPAHAHDTAEMLYRTVGPEWHLPYEQNFYSVPWTLIGLTLPVRITERELIVYGSALHEITRHALWPPGANQRVTNPAHAPGRNEKRRHEQLAQRFAELGSEGRAFSKRWCARRYEGRGPPDSRAVGDLCARGPGGGAGSRVSLPRVFAHGGRVRPGGAGPAEVPDPRAHRGRHPRTWRRWSARRLCRPARPPTTSPLLEASDGPQRKRFVSGAWSTWPSSGSR
jgi:hypothetical protein